MNKVFEFKQKNAKTKNLDTKGTLKFNSAGENRAELCFYGDIVSDSWEAYWYEEDKCPQDISDFLAGLDEYAELDIYINSGGGSVYGGLAIYNILKRYQGKKTVYIDGLAASIASVIAFAGDKVIMPENAQLMIHKPWCYAEGDAEMLRKSAEVLDVCQESIISVYAEHAKVTKEEIVELVNAETWLTGKRAAEIFNVEVEVPAEPENRRPERLAKRAEKPKDDTNKLKLLQAELNLLGL